MLPHTFLFGVPLALSGDERLMPYAAVGIALGVYLFYRGFRMLQYKRLILNTILTYDATLRESLL